MKLETTLQERPGFLHALPVFDLFFLVTMLLLMGPLFWSQSGVSVEVPASQFQMQRYQESVVVTLGPGEPEPRIHLGRYAVTFDELRDRLLELKDDEAMSRAIVLLRSDAGVTVGVERSVTEMIIAEGFKLALVGRSAAEAKAEAEGLEGGGE